MDVVEPTRRNWNGAMEKRVSFVYVYVGIKNAYFIVLWIELNARWPIKWLYSNIIVVKEAVSGAKSQTRSRGDRV